MSASERTKDHVLVLKGIDDGEAARYRLENVVISGASIPPDFLHLPAEMAALVAWHEQAQAMSPVERAAQLHTRFVKIHPFVDGNGRTGRLLLNLELMKFGYPPAVIRKEDRLAYYDALARLTGRAAPHFESSAPHIDPDQRNERDHRLPESKRFAFRDGLNRSMHGPIDRHRR